MAKSTLSDNSTIWNSTFRRPRLTEQKGFVNEALNDVNIVTQLVSEWTRLTELCDLLKFFARHADKLQPDSSCLSYEVECS